MSEPFWVKDDAGSYHITQPVSAADIVALAAQILEESVLKGESLEKPSEAAELFKTKLGLKEHEEFAVAWLDNRHRLICFEVLFTGTINSSSVYPREVVKRGLALNAGAVIIGHNHPSGVTNPSQSDIAITKRLKDALELVEIRLLDHLVIAGNEHVSLAERGEM